MKLTINCLGRELYLVLQQLRGGGDRGQAGGAQEELAQDLGQEGGHRDWGCQPLPRSGETCHYKKWTITFMSNVKLFYGKSPLLRISS